MRWATQVFGFLVQQNLGLLGFYLRLAVLACTHALNVKVASPFGDHQRGDAIADQVGQCPCF